MKWPYNSLAKAELTSAFAKLLYNQKMPKANGFCTAWLKAQPFENEVDTLTSQDKDGYMSQQKSSLKPEWLSSGE
jgi:hypothetical protein